MLAHLRCPVCDAPLRPAPGALHCARGHAFDLARQGYAQLTAGPLRHTGDTAAMVAARAAFLAAGHYRFIADALAVAAPPGGLFVEVGAGTGYHLAAVLDARPAAVGLALDASKPAARRAARAHPRASAVVCDTWHRLPVADHAASLVLDVFAPRHGAELRRVLAADGVLLVVTAEPDHLAELVTALGLLRVDPAKAERLAGTLAGFTLLAEERRQAVLRLSAAEVRALVAMGPSAWHTEPDRLAALPEPYQVTAAVRLSRYAPG